MRLILIQIILLLSNLIGISFAQDNPIDFIKVNCGGPEIEEIGFLKDEAYFYKESSIPPKSYEDVLAPLPQDNWAQVYRTHRYVEGGSLTYRFPVPDGIYSVGLMFIEQYDGVGFKGGRIFNVLLNKVIVEIGLDIWSAAGGKLHTPYYLNKENIEAIDGYIEISIVGVVENPMLSGIVISGTDAATILWETKAPTEESKAITSENFNTIPIRNPLSTPISNINSNIELIGSGKWNDVEYSSGLPIARHEACAVFANGLLYNIGGRGKKAISVYDPITSSWKTRTAPPVEINHMQCIYYGNKIYIGGSWYGEFPFEKEHENMWVYDITNDKWNEIPGLSEERRRGGGAFVEYKGKFYLSHGARGGHGAHAKTTGMLDMYDPKTNIWTSLSNAPNPRDHTTGSIINDKLCIAGGRNGGSADFWNANIAPIDCYNFLTSKWEIKANLPIPRAGTMVTTTCQGKLMIAGGEGKTIINQAGQAFDRVDFFNEDTNTFDQPNFMTSSRHGTGIGITSCSCGNIYIPSGSASLGGGPEVTTTDVWSADGILRKCI